METKNLRSYVLLDETKYRHNIRTLLKSGKKMIAVIKANAYGFGDLEAARILKEEGVDFFAVSSIDEALHLRKGGVSGEILILGHTAREHADLIRKNDLSIVTVSKNYVEDFGKDLKGIKIHLKLNTGMNRIGIRPEEARETLDLLLSYGADVRGVMTHYVSSDDDEAYTKHQYELFRSCVETLNYPFEYVHLQNSDGSVHFPNDLTTHIRPGIALLGYSSYESDLEPCVGLYAEVVESKIIHAGETVSYGRHYTAEQDVRILTLPIGYADGFYRSNTGKEVYVNGEYGIIRGSVCMDQMMIETKNDVPLGTPVELYGPHVDLTKRAKELGTINYELLTSLSDRLTRVYVEEGTIRKIDRPRFSGTGR